ncbi:Ctf18p [Sugiyamaella lignohabitans]|uniref:Ctf18p n=1 Tax=Sugiyamaella lignohabitans TaxID=796027 RepID=A0A167FJY6_9ASCO|nr:Ctf18p [Sugiyamaella lignohabitans]ANB15398.1 Ctf18p [Sugiyamaella lignohabitans]
MEAFSRSVASLESKLNYEEDAVDYSDLTNSILFSSIPVSSQDESYVSEELDNNENNIPDINSSSLLGRSEISVESGQLDLGEVDSKDSLEIAASSLFDSNAASSKEIEEDVSNSVLFTDTMASAPLINAVPSLETISVLEKSVTSSLISPHSNEGASLGSDVGYHSTYQTTLSTGKKVEFTRKERSPGAQSTSSERNHYGIPIHSLLQSVRLESEIVKSSVNLPLPSKAKQKCSDILLSEKWRPKRWVDLMGPEKTHRHLLKWLVSWSHVVFRTPLPPHEQLESDVLRRDRFGRPNKKVLLIHGAPGTGKTTIAHVLAKQAGYDVLEINASDERSGQIVREKIISAVESHRIDSSRKPVCIIADEIEGAAESGFIRVLIDLITADQKAMDSIENTASKPNHKGKKKRSKLLLRPIIAVCNDVYASSLRNLRPFAEVVHYTKSAPSAVVTRLREICLAEGIKLDTNILAEIVNTSDGDLRSSLNMLQFGGLIDEPDNSERVFRKDTNKSWSKIANRLFQRKDGVPKNEEARAILREIYTNGEYDKMISGTFSLYPRVHYHDDMLRKPSAIGEWLYFYEQLNSGIYGSQHTQLGEYLAHPLQAFYENFSSMSNTRDQLVQSNSDTREAHLENEQLVNEILERGNNHIRQMFKKDEIAIELIPYALKIVSPEIKTHISSGVTLQGIDQEKIANSAKAMIDLSLRFFKDKLESGAFAYRIDP